jgi:hypothetical protein
VGADRVLENFLRRERQDVVSILADVITILEWIKKHPLKESASGRGKFWPQFVGAFIGTLIAMGILTGVAAIIVARLNLWLNFYSSYFSNPVVLICIGTVTQLGFPFIIGLLFRPIQIAGIWRFILALLIPLLIALLVAEIFRRALNLDINK